MCLQLRKVKGQRRLHIHEFLIDFHLLIRLGHDIAFHILHDIAMQNMLSIIQQITFRFQLKADGRVGLCDMSTGMQLIIFLLHMMINGLITHDDQSQRWTLHTSHAHAFSSQKQGKQAGIIDSHYIICNCTGIGASSHSTQFFIIIDQIMKGLFDICRRIVIDIYPFDRLFILCVIQNFVNQKLSLIIRVTCMDDLVTLLHQCHNLFHTVLFISIRNQLPVFKADRKILFFPFFIFPIILIRLTQAQKVSVCPGDNDILLTYDAADFLTAAVNRSRNRSTQLRLFRNDQRTHRIPPLHDPKQIHRIISEFSENF